VTPGRRVHRRTADITPRTAGLCPGQVRAHLRQNRPRRDAPRRVLIGPASPRRCSLRTTAWPRPAGRGTAPYPEDHAHDLFPFPSYHPTPSPTPPPPPDQIHHPSHHPFQTSPPSTYPPLSFFFSFFCFVSSFLFFCFFRRRPDISGGVAAAHHRPIGRGGGRNAPRGLLFSAPGTRRAASRSRPAR